jgi:uncharacterized protein
VLLCDTGVLLAAGNVKDHARQACLRLLRHAEGPLLVPSPVPGEIGYLLQSRAGAQAEVTFLRSSGGNGFKVAGLQGTGTGRNAVLSLPSAGNPATSGTAGVSSRSAARRP